MEIEKGLPEAVSVALCFAVRDKIVMFGGEVKPSERGHAGAGNFRDGGYFTSMRTRKFQTSELRGLVNLVSATFVVALSYLSPLISMPSVMPQESLWPLNSMLPLPRCRC